MQPNMVACFQSGVWTAWLKSIGVGPVDPDPPLLEHGREVVQLLVGLLLHLLGQRPVGPQRDTVLRPVALDRGLGRLDHGAVGPADDNVFEGVPLVPGADLGLRGGHAITLLLGVSARGDRGPVGLEMREGIS